MRAWQDTVMHASLDCCSHKAIRRLCRSALSRRWSDWSFLIPTSIRTHYSRSPSVSRGLPPLCLSLSLSVSLSVFRYLPPSHALSLAACPAASLPASNSSGRSSSCCGRHIKNPALSVAWLVSTPSTRLANVRTLCSQRARGEPSICDSQSTVSETQRDTERETYDHTWLRSRCVMAFSASSCSSHT